MNQNNKLTIVAHLAHHYDNGEWYSYEPYVREIEIWCDLFEEVSLYTDVRFNFESTLPLKVLPKNCNVIGIKMQAGPGWRNNLLRFVQLPLAFLRVWKVVHQSEFLHLRSIGVTTTMAILLNIFYKKKTIIKWPTIFESIPQMTLIQRFELSLLKKAPRNSFVMVYGKSERTNHVSSFPALFSRDEVEDYMRDLNPRDWSGTINLLCVGRMYKFKNFDFVFDALAYFNSKNPHLKWHLYFVGDGVDRPVLDSIVNNANMTDRVTFLGKLPFQKTIEVYKRSHIAIMPGKYEGWPKVINEAWATGCIPFVVNYGNAVYPLKFSPASSYVFEPNFNSFSEGLHTLIEMKKEERETLLHNARMANSNFCLENYRSHLLEIINMVNEN